MKAVNVGRDILDNCLWDTEAMSVKRNSFMWDTVVVCVLKDRHVGYGGSDYGKKVLYLVYGVLHYL